MYCLKMFISICWNISTISWFFFQQSFTRPIQSSYNFFNHKNKMKRRNSVIQKTRCNYEKLDERNCMSKNLCNIEAASIENQVLCAHYKEEEYWRTFSLSQWISVKSLVCLNGLVKLYNNSYSFLLFWS